MKAWRSWKDDGAKLSVLALVALESLRLRRRTHDFSCAIFAPQNLPRRQRSKGDADDITIVVFTAGVDDMSVLSRES